MPPSTDWNQKSGMPVWRMRSHIGMAFVAHLEGFRDCGSLTGAESSARRGRAMSTRAISLARDLRFEATSLRG
jgi:hypothetical protein